MDLLKQLCEVDAVSGDESPLCDLIERYVGTFSSNVRRDKMGNLTAEVGKGDKVKIVLEAHIDQIGLVVKKIDENGFVHFIKSGGINSSVLPTAEVVIHGKKDVFGIIGAKPPHLQTKTESLSQDDMYIDCGYDYNEIIKYVSVGDTVSFVSKFSTLQNDNISSKSLDNRVGVYVALKVLEILAKEDLPYKIAGLFSVQEEVGCRGAASAIENISPECAVVLDVTFGVSPYTSEENGFKVGSGITVAVGPNLNSRKTESFIDFCRKENVDFDIEVCADNTGTDAWPIQVAANGIKCVLISVPIKYMHTTVETANIGDIKSAVCAITKAFEGGVFNA